MCCNREQCLDPTCDARTAECPQPVATTEAEDEGLNCLVCALKVTGLDLNGGGLIAFCSVTTPATQITPPIQGHEEFNRALREISCHVPDLYEVQKACGSRISWLVDTMRQAHLSQVKRDKAAMSANR